MKRLWLAVVAVAVLLSATPSIITPHASAGTYGGSGQCILNGSKSTYDTNDPCIVLVVTLTGKNIPSSGITVTATRKINKGGADDVVTLADKSVSFGKCAAGHQDWGCSTSLAANSYTSFYGLWNTNYSSTCAAADQSTATYTIAASGSATGSVADVNLCSIRKNTGVPGYSPIIAKVNLPVGTASTPLSTGGVNGKAGYYYAQGVSGNCDPSSNIYVYDGPNKLSEGNTPYQTGVKTDGTYATSENIPPGSGYTVSILCYSDSTHGLGSFTDKKQGVTIKGGQFTTVNFSETQSSSAGGGQYTGQVGGGNSSASTCESTGGPFSWAICGAIRMINDAESAVEGEVQNLLRTRPLVFNAKPTCNATDATCANQELGSTIYKVWSTFRVYGDIILVIALLVIVFGESLGGGMIDAYTAKKVLPRILIAAILINLSIYIVAIMEDIVNVIGNGLVSLLEDPFKILAQCAPGATSADACKVMSTVKVSGGTGLVLSAGVLVIMGATWIAGFGAFMLIIVIPMLLAVIGVLVTIALRQGLLVLLLLVSPIAFALYVLPNTEQYFKKWWGLLMKTLLVYPIVMAVFALAYISGVVMSHLVPASILSQALSVLAVVAPMFMIPFAFKLSGGLIGNVQSMMTGMVAKASKPMRKKGMQRAAGRLDRAQKQSLYSNNSALGRFGNKLATWTTAPGSNALYHAATSNRRGLRHLRNVPGIGTAGQRVASQLHHARMEQSTNLLKELNESYMFNDKAYRALSGAYDGFSDPVKRGLVEAGFMDASGRTLKTVKSAKDVEDMAKVLSENGSDTDKIAANALHGASSRLNTLFLDPEMGKAGIQAAGIMGLSSHGFASSHDIANVANQIGEQDVETAHAVASRAQVLGQQQRPDVKAGYGVLFDPTSKKFTGVFDQDSQGNLINADRAKALMQSVKVHDWMGAKAPSISASSTVMAQLANEKDAAGNYTADAKAIQDTIAQGASQFSSSDPSAKVAWRKIAEKIPGLSDRIAIVDSRRAKLEEPDIGDGGSPGQDGLF
ncbi:MAG TPA: hypothetical protein VHD60_01805 [Candidatus Saccharimonadales bacterium]|nr:hypothetical protein [Candidatus Saccharimonadales bacterium]